MKLMVEEKEESAEKDASEERNGRNTVASALGSRRASYQN